MGCLFLGEALLAQTTYYVKTGGSDGNSGTSWAGAFRTLQKALATAVSSDQIWTAAGIYYPDEGPGQTADSRRSSFGLKNGVTLYGGFAGTETAFSQRNLRNHVTILSGDLTQNDSSLFVNSYDNAYHVVSGNGSNSTAVLNGFVVTGGNANAPDFGVNACGGGLYAWGASPTLTNCIFFGNQGILGGAIYLFGSSTIVNCSFLANQADLGGAIYFAASSAHLVNCSFTANKADYAGGALFCNGSTVTMVNCILWGDVSPTGPENLTVYPNNDPSITYSIVQGGFPGVGNRNEDPLFVNAVGGNLHLQACSPAINRGNNAANNAAIDLDGTARIKHTTIDMGAYEFDGTSYTSHTYYADADGDSYGSGAGQPFFCPTPPAGYSADQADCNDNDPAEHPGQTWYKDADDDGYSDGTTQTQCTRPAGYKTATELTATTGDCDDANASVNPANLWYKDLDGDGYSDGQTLTQCTQPAGYKPASSLTATSGDCNDNDAGIHAPQTYYADNDGDGFGDPNTTTTVCALLPPPNFVADNTDCDDTKALYQDNDGDGYGSNLKVACGGVANNNDCNDADNTVHPGAITCPTVPALCFSSSGTYTIAPLGTGKDCNVSAVSYAITGATTRSGSGSNASGTFGVGTSTITWMVQHADGSSSSCQTTVTVNQQITVSIPDAKVLSSGVNVNTVYTGYAPASSLTLTASGSGGSGSFTYKWSTNATTQAITVSPTAATNYTVTVTDAKGCTATASKGVAVMDVRCGNKLDKVNVCHNGGTSCVDKTSVADHLAHGDYLGTCTVSNAVTVTTNRVSDISVAKADQPDQLIVRAYPNPSRTAFTVQVGSAGKATGKVVLRISDAMGRTVETRTVRGGSTLQLGAGYRPGIYFVEIVQGEERRGLKLIKQ